MTTDSCALWILVILVALDLLLAWKESRARVKDADLSYGAQRMHTRAIVELARAVAISAPSGQIVLTSIGSRLNAILGKEEQILMEIDDLKQALADLEAQESSVVQGMTAAVNELQTLEQELQALANQQTVSPADLANATLRIKAVTSNLGAAVTALAAAAPPAPAPAASAPAAAAPAPAADAAPAPAAPDPAAAAASGS